MDQIGANEPAQAGQRPDIKAELLETLGVRRDLGAEHPYLVTALL
jgi:hypothetical protein